MSKKLLTTITTLLVALFFITSCSNQSIATSNLTRSLGESDFTGKYANDYYQFYKSALNDNVANLVVDNEFSDQDLHDVQDIYIKCMSEIGVTVSFSEKTEDAKGDDFDPTFLNDKTAFENYSNRLAEKQMSCYNKTDLENAQNLYEITHGKKSQLTGIELDKSRIKCLIKNELVPADYTIDDYSYDWGKTDKQMHGVVKLYWEDTANPKRDTYWNCQNNPPE